MTRRDLFCLAGGLASSLPLCGAEEAGMASVPDFVLRLQESTVELAPGKTVKTVAYNGSVPGPLLRMKKGRSVTIEVVNDTSEPEMVHWHGLRVPPETDGAHEEGTPMVQAHDRRRFTYTPTPAGTRWYHAHAMAGHNLSKGTYSGQFGMIVVDESDSRGNYDAEIPLILHEWDPFFSTQGDVDVDYRMFSVNGRMLGAADPIRVRQSQRVLFRVLNASATLSHRLALPRHEFEVVALDGNPVSRPARVPVLDLAPGERVDAIVEMSAPGVWILGELNAGMRKQGAGIVLEYAGATGKPSWAEPAPFTWDYTIFGGKQAQPVAASTISLVFEPRSDGNLWAINGKSYPNTAPFFVVPGVRNRLVFDNRSEMMHPVHLHRHTFEITRYGSKATSGVLKDVVSVPARSKVEVDLTPDSPGPALFHCHQQFHMDFGFMTLMQYRSEAGSAQ